ncbi:MAG: AraC family transcriptional regulator [Gammaproteobacteria bacterium]|jgi:AraC-like DNA-binding protein
MASQQDEITTLGSVATLLAEALRSCDRDPVPLFAAAGIDMPRTAQCGDRIPTTRMQTLWRLAVEATGDPCLGLVVARHFQPVALHGLGFAWLASDTLYAALERLVRYSRFINTAVDFRLEKTADSIDLVNRISRAEWPDFVFAAADLAMAAFLRMCQITASHAVMPRRVNLQRPRPPCARDFIAVFGPNIQYDAPENRLSFDRALVEAPLSMANPELARLNDQMVIDYLARHDGESLTMQVRAKIIELMPDGRPGQEVIADALHMSLRSLQRKLQNEGTSFTTLLHETQQQLAIQYVRESHRSIGEITYLLGYSEPGSFTRAFRRWTGKSPLQFRGHRQVSPSAMQQT